VVRRLGRAQALGTQRPGKLALWQVFVRLMNQCFRLSAIRLADSHAASVLLGLDPFHQEHRYPNLAWWLAQCQEAIEARLFRRRYGVAAPPRLLFDAGLAAGAGVGP